MDAKTKETAAQTEKNQALVEKLKAELEEREARIAELEEREAAHLAELEAGKQATVDENDLKRRVKIRIESGIGQRDPVVVRVNDYSAIIKRGVTVEVPYYVALSIQESQDADVRTNLRIQELTDIYEASKPKD